MPPTPDNPPQDSRAVLNTHFYAALRDVAGRVFAGERGNHTLQPTAVVNEACMRIMSSGLPDVPREEQLAIAGRVLRQVLIDHSRGRNAQKRGNGALVIQLDDNLVSDEQPTVDFDCVHEVIERLAKVSPRQAEVVTLRIFSGLAMEQIATVIGVSKRSVEGDWAVARAWLRRELARTDRQEDAADE